MKLVFSWQIVGCEPMHPVYQDDHRGDWISKICGQEGVWSLENCMKHTFMYKAVKEKKISAGIWCTTGRKGYTGREMWRGNGDIQTCMVCYKAAKIQTGTVETKVGISLKSLLSL